MLVTWSKAAIKARGLVLFIWLALTVFGLYGAANLAQLLTTSLSVPGSSSAAANEILNKDFKANTEGTFTVIYKYKQASAEQIATFKASVAQAARIIPGSEITNEKAFAGTLYSNIGTPFDLKRAASYTQKLRNSLIKNGLSEALVTGPPAIESDVVPILSMDLRKGQLIAIVLASLLLIATLGVSWSILIPFLFGLATVSTSLGIIFLLAQKFLMVLYIPNIVELIGLGLAIDYSLLMVHRYRKEIATSNDPLVNTMKTAGRTAVISGFTVATGLATLLFIPVPFIRSLGLACLVLPLVSILAVITLQPVLLSILVNPSHVSNKGILNLSLDRLTNISISKPRKVFTSTIIGLSIVSAALLWLQVTPSSLSAIPAHLQSAQALNAITSKVGIGVITPHEIVIDLGPNRFSPEISSARLEFAKKLAKNKEVFTVATGEKWPYVEASGRYLRIYVFGQHDLGSSQTQQLVWELRNTYIPAAGFPVGTQIYLGGAPAQGVDLLHAIGSSLPKIIIFMMLITFLILLKFFRSIVLAIKAILLGIVSVVTSIAIVVLFFKFGLGVFHEKQIEAWALVIIFAILFGLSMDYEIFIVSRMREARDHGLSNEDSIREGMRNSGTVVTAAALIFVTALTGLISGHFAGLQQLGIGLAAGVIIDVTVIRGMLLPSAMVLLGAWNWWLPGQEKPRLSSK